MDESLTAQNLVRCSPLAQALHYMYSTDQRFYRTDRSPVYTQIQKHQISSSAVSNTKFTHPGCGGVAVGTKTFLIDATTGPFLVSYPNTNISRAGNSELTVLWDVAGTDGGNVNCSDVDIYCSVDGGYTWTYQLAESVPNSGSAVVVLPAITTNAARIKVKGDGSIFFDISNANFTITAVQGCTDPTACNFMDIASVDDGSCQPPGVLYADADGDGFGNADVNTTGCEGSLIGFVTNATDCDDSRNDVYPGAPGTQDGVDNDCSGGPLAPDEESQCPVGILGLEVPFLWGPQGQYPISGLPLWVSARRLKRYVLQPGGGT